MFGLGWQEILVILLIVLVLFGARRLPELARSLGQGIREFRKSVKEISEDTRDDDAGHSGKTGSAS
jgi:sec-independent protein translocase protein TatA